MNKRCTSIILTGLMSLSAFAEKLYDCSPVYEVYRDTYYFQIHEHNFYRDLEAPCEKGTEITGTPYYWTQRDKDAPNYLSPYIDPYDIKIKDSDTFDDYVLGSIDEEKVKGRWLPVWYFEAVRQKDREIVAMAEPDRLVLDNDVLPVEVPWYECYGTAAYMDITNTGFFFNTPLKTFSRYGFVFENLKRIDENTYAAKVYPSLYDYNERASWFPYLENFPSLKDGKPFTARFEINGKAMKIYNNETDKILFDLIQVPIKWATSYCSLFIKENIVIEPMTVPEEYTNRKEEEMFRMDRSLAKGKFMLSKGNLKLRADESTSSELIVTMAKDSWVKIQSIGKEETIDGITSKWMQVSPVRNSVDANGKKVRYIVGWCFGGYLEEESETADASATGLAEPAEKAALPENILFKPAPAMEKTATVTENLRLRTDDTATAEVVMTLAAGTRVKVEALGKEETIDGIMSNWVWVETLDGTKDKDGNAIEAGTKGWLFGGYLSEAESAAESESPNKEAESADANAKQNAALPILPIAAVVAALAVLLAAILLAVKKRKAGKE